MSLEKRQILSEMIAFAREDNKIRMEEYDFIVTTAQSLGISKVDVDDLFKNPVPTKVPKTEIQRITQFHRLILLMNVDKETHVMEVDAIRDYGLKMGIRPEAIEQILNEMNDYQDKIIPSDRLVQIFKRFYN